MFSDRLQRVLADFVPEGALPINCIVITEWVEPDGDAHFECVVADDVTFSSTIGLLEMAKHHLMNEANPPEVPDAP